MPLGEVLKRKQELLSQYRVLGVPTENELRGSDNVVYVHAYTREDGTEVKAHYRSKGVNEGVNKGAGVNMTSDTRQEKEIIKEEDNKEQINANPETNYQEQNQEINKKTEPPTQEKDKRLYPDEIAGVKRGEPMTFEEVVRKGVNPSYDKTAENDKGDGNCNSCVAAYIYCRRGYDVNAASTLDNKKAEELSHNGLDLWIEAETGEIAKWTEFNNDNQSTFDFLNETIKPGEIYELAQYPQLKAGDLSTIDGHVVVVEKGSDGQLKIYDPQKREVYENSSKTKMYIDSWIDAKEMARDIYPKFIRVDNKQINPYYEGVLVH